MVEHRNKGGSLVWYPKALDEKGFVGTNTIFGWGVCKPSRPSHYGRGEVEVPTELRYDRSERRWNHELTKITFLTNGKKEASK